MRTRILHYRKDNHALSGTLEIGCRVLTQPFFLPENRWFPPPASWAKNIVSFRGYETSEQEGLALWEAVQDWIVDAQEPMEGFSSQRQARYGEPTIVRPRLGQGAFRVIITDAYRRRCAITGERTLPALEAAHIRPFAEGGEHSASNGILMRRDVHSLFDAGYVTINKENRFEVSRRIREEFENGRHYYELHGSEIALPATSNHRPDPLFLMWHNENRFLG